MISNSNDMISLTWVSKLPIIVVHKNLQGEQSHFVAFKECIDKALQTNAQKLIMDFTCIDYLASTSIGLIAKTYSTLVSRGGELVVVLSPEDTSLQRLLKITRLSTVLKIVNKRERAIKLLSTRA